MVRLLILVAVVVGVAWWLMKRRRPPPADTRETSRQSGKEPAAMIACAHCGVHLPRPDASFDAEGRSYCGEPHRVAGPR
jgi:uncharacterized protein